MPEESVYRLELALRRYLPERVKSALRLGRLAMQPVPPPAPQIPQAQLDGCQLLCNRHEMLRRLPPGGIIAEIGTHRGDFARIMLDTIAPARLHLADITFSLCRADVLADPRVERHEGTSRAFLNSRTEASFDITRSTTFQNLVADTLMIYYLVTASGTVKPDRRKVKR